MAGSFLHKKFISVHLRIYKDNEHGIDAKAIDPDALDTIFQLKDAGFQAYLVGGGVRDLILGKKPKDFDISTSAEPEEIKRLFQKKCLLIGRRFRLAHIRYGKKILEVSTFRAGDVESGSLIVRDNSWGSAEEDVMRRDFSCNALFYDPSNCTVLDYVGGVEDIHHKILRTIGEPVLRFRQDPVRMIRLLKFQARFGFHVEPKTQHAMKSCREEILKSSPERLLEEMFKMLESGAAKPFFELMNETGFLDVLFPCFHHFFQGHHRRLAEKYLHALDHLNLHRREPLDRPVQLAALVFPILEQELITLTEDRQSPICVSDIIHLSETLLQGIDTSSFAHFPKRLL
ncbi:MAG TPA: polynucleotide adenylyltransferase PcnB, partial [Chlamydiales bacterium]|nr:polynucleotide adenylyltransferase PcnB [Chlamydiales bacterium]